MEYSKKKTISDERIFKYVFPAGILFLILLSFFLFFPKRIRGIGEEAAEKANLPVLSITLDSGTLPGDEDERGILKIDNGPGKQPVFSFIEMNLRGNTSRRFPKKSYRVKTIRESGQKRNVSIAALRSDDDWILNPMYSDTSKIREALAYWLWDEMNSCGRKAMSSHFEFAELYLNGSYHGLYGIQERIDRKQVDADRHSGILYKIKTNEKPAASELAECGNTEIYKGIERVFTGDAVKDPWGPAAGYLEFLESGSADGRTLFSVENTVDYALWAVLVQACDCHFKNQFIHAEKGKDGYILYRIPWDLNNTMGDLWDGSAEDSNYITYQFTDLALDDVMKKLLEKDEGFWKRKLRERWSILREDLLTEERILEKARSLYYNIYEAAGRDSERWPECGTGEGNAANIRDVEDYFRMILPRIDAWTASFN